MLFSTKATLAIFAVLGVLVTNFETCSTASLNTDEGTEKDEITRETDTKTSAKICNTQECKSTAESIRKYMDPSLDPCHDFYEFACSAFLKSTVIPEDQAEVNQDSITGDLVQQQIQDSIEHGITDKSPRAFKLLKSIYDSCMNTKQIEANSEQEMRNILKTLGGWPVADGKLWKESAFDWLKSAVQFRDQGYSVSYFIGFGVTTDLKNTSRRVITIDQALTGIRQEYLSNGLTDKLVQAYLECMIDLAVIFGADRNAAKAELTESVKFEIELAKISMSPEDRRDLLKTYNPMTVAQLQKTYPAVPWFKYINDLLAPQSKVELQDTVIVAVPSYLARLSELIGKTPKRVLANYAMGHAVFDSTSYLSERVQKTRDKLSIVFSGTILRPPRVKYCRDYVSSNVNIPVSALYVRRYFDEPSKTDVSEIIENIRKIYLDIVTKVDWMDEKTRKTALDKISKIRPFIGYPSELLDDKKLDEFYKSLTVYPDSFLKNVLSLSIFYVSLDMEQLRQPVDKNDWTSHSAATTVNTAYSFDENSIDCPAGILRGHFYNRDRPKYMNYGAIGWLMGHELTHSNDDQGSLFDAQGNLNEWWQPETKKKFLKQVQCFIDQYSKYEVKEVGMKVNGELTQGENVADNGGLREAYFAYEAYEKQHGEEAQLPGLPYTPKQMFFISSAIMWCDKIRPELLKSTIISDVHSPSRFRVNGPMSNMREFSQVFNCPAGSAMNPDKRCMVW